MKKYGLCLLLGILCLSIQAQRVLNLDDCRRLAIENNKQLKINSENIKKAEAQKKEAFTQFLPNFSLTAAYFYNQKNISLLDADKYLPIGSLMADGSFGFTADQVNNQWTVINGDAVPLDANGQVFNPSLNPEKIQWKEYTVIPKDQFELNIHNIFVGAVSVTQPIYMGGRIRSYNEISDYAVQLAESVNEAGIQDAIVQVDQAYWQGVSLANKLRLTDKLVELLNRMNQDVESLIREGVATKADGLSVRVKLNEAEMAQMQASNGLQLSKMLLCQLCGLPLDEPIILTDEYSKEIKREQSPIVVDLNKTFIDRPELKSLNLASKIYEKKEDIVRSETSPTIALTGNYLVNNPNSFDGIKHKFGGMWNVGVMMNMPLFHWGEKKHKMNAAKTETRIKRLEIEDAKEKIELQINRDVFRLSESEKKLTTAEKNKENAEENLRYANLGFKEGVIPISNLMEAQTAWYKAHSDLIDTQIEIQFNRIQLAKTTGSMEIK